ncbi:MAG: hypothetical protein DSY66_02475 [Persephonella sp.]|nr:MAG: hypothetical protein DSY53_01690 [Persephonella sp.]RUM61351.1 MAG: hypothetical protein DSY66_02475 [Persephonella sp.]
MKFKVSEDTKISLLLEHYPETEDLIKEYFKFFYENRLEDIVLNRLSLKGAFNVLDFDTKKRKEVLDKLSKLIENKE